MDGKNQLDFQVQNFFRNIVKKKKIIEKIKYARSLPDHQLVRSCSHQQPYNFFLIFVNFQTLPDNSEKTKISRFKAEKLALTQENFLVDYLRRKDFQSRSKKNPYILNYWEFGVTNYVSIVPFCDHKSLQIASFSFYFSFAIDKAKVIAKATCQFMAEISQPA